MTIEEDRTRVKVAVRVRPQLHREINQACRVCTYVNPDEPQVTLGDDKMYTFDNVFDRMTSQEEIYNGCVNGLVEGLFDGFNATILAYGQTGSGKTYSMGTGFDLTSTPEQLGIIPRALQHIFHGMQKRKKDAVDKGLLPPEFAVNCQFLELYNEEIFDLLDDTRTRGAKSNIRIHEDADGNIYPAGILSREVHSVEATMKCLQDGALHRTTAATNMNKESSRSHGIFTLLLQQKRIINKEKDSIEEKDEDEDVVVDENEEKTEEESEALATKTTATNEMDVEYEVLTAKFHFTDLAGSERLKRTGATGQRQKEGISINSGLLALGKVISALGDPAKTGSHVPYRDSKLTRLLADSLGGNSRTLMIACISPSDSDFIETKNTLSYAYCVKNIKNKVSANQDKTSKQINIYKQRIASLQLIIQEYQMGKRVANSESLNDMFQENTLLQDENSNLRMRVKAMQETINAQKDRMVRLEAAKILNGTLEGNGKEESGDGVGDIIEKYINENEQLRLQLLESEAMCENFRKKSQTSLVPMSPFTGRVTRLNTTPIPMSGSIDFDLFENGNASFEDNDAELLQRAKQNLTELVHKKEEIQKSKKKEKQINADENGEEEVNMDETNEGEMLEDPEEISEMDSEEEEEEELGNISDEEDDKENVDMDEQDEITKQQQQDLGTLSCEIDIKEQLVQRFEEQQRRYEAMRTMYESKLRQLTEKIRCTEVERDQVLTKIVSKNPNKAKTTEEMQKVKVQYQRKLENMQKDLFALQKGKKKYNALMRNHAKNEQELKKIKSELDTMKKLRVNALNAMKDVQKKNKVKDSQQKRQINSLIKDHRKYENTIRTLQSKNKSNEVQVKRKQEEIVTLRRQLKPISGTFGKKKRELEKKKDTKMSQNNLNRKWQTIEKKINDVVTQREAITQLERQMERYLTERRNIQTNIHKSEKRIRQLKGLNKPKIEIEEFEAECTNHRENVEFLSSQIQECQSDIMEVENALEVDLDVKELLKNVNMSSEIRFFFTQFITMSISKATSALTTQNKVSELQASLEREQMSMKEKEELILLMMHERREIDPHLADIISARDGSSNESSREPSPDPDNEYMTINDRSKSKARRRTPLPQELLYGINKSSSLSTTLSEGSGENNTIFGYSLPKPVFEQPELEESTLIPENEGSIIEVLDNEKTVTNDLNSTYTITTHENSSKPSSPAQEQKPHAVPGSFLKPSAISSIVQSNVFSRLTFSINSPRNVKGRIVEHSSKVVAAKSEREPLQCKQLAQGHNKPILCIKASDHLLFSGSKDRTCKVWNLVTGQEIMSLDGHPNNVHALEYCSLTNLLYTVSLCYIKVWDIRCKGSCINILSSSGQTLPHNQFTQSMGRTNRIPDTDALISNIRVCKQSGNLFAATRKDVKVWDIKKPAIYARLTGHAGEVKTIAVLDNPKRTVFTGSKDHYVKMYDVPMECSGNISAAVTLEPPHMDGVEALAVSTKHNVLFSGSRDKQLKKWCLETKQVIKTEYQAHSSWINALVITDQLGSDEALISGGKHGFLKVWDVESGGSIGEIKAHEDSINDIAVNRDRIFTASSDSTVKIWQVR